MKITIEISDDLLRAAEQRATEFGEALQVLIENSLRRELATPCGQSPDKAGQIKWVVAEGGLPAGIDLSNRAEMYDRLLARKA
jgi:hypothetical protein